MVSVGLLAFGWVGLRCGCVLRFCWLGGVVGLFALIAFVLYGIVCCGWCWILLFMWCLGCLHVCFAIGLG